MFSKITLASRMALYACCGLKQVMLLAVWRATYCDVAVHIILNNLERRVAKQVKELDETLACFQESSCVDAALGRHISEGL